MEFTYFKQITMKNRKINIMYIYAIDFFKFDVNPFNVNI